jgi:cation transport ATPase
MLAITYQQNGQSATRSNQTASERPERPEAPERPERPELTTVSTGQLGDQIRSEVQQSLQSASREIQQAVRDAEQHVRTAEQHLREARTADQRGAAQQELMGARDELRALQSVSRTFTSPRFTMQQSGFPAFPPNAIPSQVVDISIAFFIMFAVIIIGWPLARAFGRRLERRGQILPGSDPALAGQLQRIEQAVEAMSIEIERISESQRFMAKLQSETAAERNALGTGDRR